MAGDADDLSWLTPTISDHPWPPGHRGHWWSGWPGAHCMRCGAEHALENALADGWYDPVSDQWDSDEHKRQVEEADGTCPADDA